MLSQSALMFALLATTVLCDVAGQVCFKLGVGHDDDAGIKRRAGIAGFVLDLIGSPWVVSGLLIYVVEFIVWFAALSLAPLSVAFPFMALSYCGVVVASRWILKERVSLRRWLGTAAVAGGVALVCWP
ncbi:MAG: EamA family transporter [Rudaea sp.]|nr:EamA family transporter [Rudaea sp.]